MLIMGLSVAVGCGPANTGVPQNMREGDAEAIDNLIRSLSDKAANKKDFMLLFADGYEVKDADRTKVAKNFVRIADGTDPEINGDTATVQVGFQPYGSDEDPVVTTWECQRQSDDTWLISKAEFPPK